MIKIEKKCILWKNDLTNFVHTLAERLYNHLPEELSIKIDEGVEGIVLGSMPQYMEDDVGAYCDTNKKIYLSEGLLYECDPKKIAEVMFHEFGHPLLNDEFKNIDSQISADFLAIYSINSCDVFEGRKNKSIQYYKLLEKKIYDLLGENEKFLEENKKLIEDTKEEWYPKLQEEVATLYRINPAKIPIEKDIELEKIYPEYRKLIYEYKNDDNPIRNLYRIKVLENIKEILTSPVKDLSGRTFDIPYELAKRIEERTGIFVGCGCFMTPKNDIPYTLKEIIENGMRFDVKHSFFHK